MFGRVKGQYTTNIFSWIVNVFTVESSVNLLVYYKIVSISTDIFTVESLVYDTSQWMANTDNSKVNTPEEEALYIV